MENNRWTFSKALSYVQKANYKGLTFWSASDFLYRFYFIVWCELRAEGII